ATHFSRIVVGLFSVGIVAAASVAGCKKPDSPKPSSCPCCPDTSCEAEDKSCLGLVDNAGRAQFGLRMSQLRVTAPAALSKGLVSTMIDGAVTPSNSDCHLEGSGTFNGLLQFDTAAHTLKMGGAKPVADVTAGYSFVDETVNGLLVQPTTY